MDDEPEQEALFQIEGPDEDGCVWVAFGDTKIGLGATEVVAEVMCQWLGSIDYGECA